MLPTVTYMGAKKSLIENFLGHAKTTFFPEILPKDHHSFLWIYLGLFFHSTKKA
jgi:hypothetical protein